MNIFLRINHHLNASNSYQTKHGHKQEQEKGSRHVKTCLTGNRRCVFFFFFVFFYLLYFIYRFHKHFLRRGWVAMTTSMHPGVTKMTTTRWAWYFFSFYFFLISLTTDHFAYRLRIVPPPPPAPLPTPTQPNNEGWDEDEQTSNGNRQAWDATHLKPLGMFSFVFFSIFFLLTTVLFQILTTVTEMQGR